MSALRTRSRFVGSRSSPYRYCPRAKESRLARIAKERASHAVGFWIPLQTELRRGSHVTKESGRGDDGGAREISFPTESHPVLPVAIERGDRTLVGIERVRPLTEARAAPRLPDLTTNRPEYLGDRFAAETGI